MKFNLIPYLFYPAIILRSTDRSTKDGTGPADERAVYVTGLIKSTVTGKFNAALWNEAAIPAFWDVIALQAATDSDVIK